VLVRKVTADKVLEGLKGEGGTVMKTSLDHTPTCRAGLRPRFPSSTCQSTAMGTALERTWLRASRDPIRMRPKMAVANALRREIMADLNRGCLSSNIHS
jgi:hypothetical protein